MPEDPLAGLPAERRVREESEYAEPVLDGHHHGPHGRQFRTPVVGFEGPAVDVGATVDPHHHRKSRPGVRRPHVQEQAVLVRLRSGRCDVGRLVEGGGNALVPLDVALVLDARRWPVGCVDRLAFRRGRHGPRCAPAPVADRRLRIADAAEHLHLGTVLGEHRRARVAGVFSPGADRRGPGSRCQQDRTGVHVPLQLAGSTMAS